MRTNNLLTLLMTVLYLSSAFAANVPTKIQTDKVIVGKAGSTSNKDLQVTNGAMLRYNQSLSKWQVSHNGSVFDVAATLTGTETLTNKTLSGNTATGLVNGSGTINFNSSGTVTVPNATGTLATLAGAEGLTNKSISTSSFDGGTASGSQFITLPAASFATLSALARVAGKIYYATDLLKVYFDNGSALLQVGSGSGSAGKNYTTNADAEVDASTGITINTASGTAVSVTRNTTSPLMDTADFSVNLRQVLNNSVTWATSATPDSFLSGQSCLVSAKFKTIVIGTGATAVMEVLQGSNTVGTVTLATATTTAPYTINFPCGDLSGATTIRLRLSVAGSSDTTLKIDDVFYGFANNLTNVSQAEFVGSVRYTPATGCAWNTSSGSFANFTATASCNTPTVAGQATTTAGKIPGATFTGLKAGRYFVIVNYTAQKQSSTDLVASYRVSDGTNFGPASTLYLSTISNYAYAYTSVLNAEYTTAPGSVTFQMQAYTNSGVSGASIQAQDPFHGFEMDVYRYPGASEVAITPSQQTAFAGIKYVPGSDYSALITASSWTTFNHANLATPTTFGKGQRPITGTCGTTNDSSICVPNVAPGTYQVVFNGTIGATNPAAGLDTFCNFRLYDGSNIIASNRVFGLQNASSVTPVLSGLSGLVTYTSYQPMVNIQLQASKASGGGSCLFQGLATANAETQPQFQFIPVSSSSPNTVFIQGPAKATGNGLGAIQAGMVGQEIISTVSYSSPVGSLTTNVAKDITSITLTPGVWELYGIPCIMEGSYGTQTAKDVSISTSPNTLAGANQIGISRTTTSLASTTTAQICLNIPAYRQLVTSNTTYYLNVKMDFSTGSPGIFGTLKAIRVD